ncbi:MAG: hypothetical protein HYZ63_00225 [Candidatus Andersenbacteria bacterium]|nr:hypothetical protein [Candidatus Andersenbacteria bacterium]
MKLLFSVPTGYHLRELVLPLRDLLTKEAAISQVIIVTPAAPYKAQLFPNWDSKFIFVHNPADMAGHEALMSQYKPDVVVTDTVGHDEKDFPILVAATKAGLKTLTFIASWDNVWKIERLLKTPGRVALAGHFTVWNQMMKDHLLQIFPDINPGRVNIIGSPRLDYYAPRYQANVPSKAALFQTLGLSDPSRPLVHFSTTELYPMDYLVKTVRQAMDSGKLPKNLALVATVHPGGNLQKHKTLEQYGALVRFAFGRQEQAPLPSFTYNPSVTDMYNAIALYKHTSILINHSSTTALESLLADVPVINIKYGQPLDWWKWYRSMVYRDFQQHYRDVTSDGATSVVGSQRQLVSEMDKYLKNPALRQPERAITIKKMITTIDGTAGLKVFTLIQKLAT